MNYEDIFLQLNIVYIIWKLYIKYNDFDKTVERNRNKTLSGVLETRETKSALWFLWRLQSAARLDIWVWACYQRAWHLTSLYNFLYEWEIKHLSMVLGED